MCTYRKIEVNPCFSFHMSVCYSVSMSNREERLVEELNALRALLAHPTVRAVVELVQEAEHQYNRAEAAHGLKDEANQRWLEAVTK